MLSKLLYVKLCFDTAAGYMGVFVGIAEKAALAFLVLDRVGVHNYLILGLAAALLVVIYGVIGHVALRHCEKLRMSMCNRYNPELMAILRRTEKDE